MTISDGDAAALAEQAAGRLAGPVTVRIDPDAGDDPYRWGQRSWLVHFELGPQRDRRISVRLTAEDTEQEAADRMAAALADLPGR
jgi:hypothetical protein